ncbi:pyroglutamyl-peptidase I [Halalkalibacterium ligniniphilum]|uniref:pyroglutamyl-peptidase I n=1 Tax=Halalkalibacterium ligniniphilum TaxID=1134413 RepID=UPI00034902B6|nr:pyroglutamyl-peptidase I [Halalkalibacterium ligniniphilum]
MKTLLLTGFVPFLGHSVNPTQRVAEELDGKAIGDYQIKSAILPVEFSKSAERLIKHFEEIKPDVVISLGLAAGRHLITPERIAINCRDGEPDNQGVKLQDQSIRLDGPDGYFSTLPIRRFVDTLQKEGLPADISNTAGTYLCNNVMYSMLDYIKEKELNTRAGFIHIPASFELTVINNKLPGWSHHDLVKAVKKMIEVLDK